jgi:4a-hydroxytetrahydrobiopterin dehydratase
MALLDAEEIENRLALIDGEWALRGDAIRKKFTFDDFRGSIDFVSRIAPVADEMNHHPDLAVSWNSVTVSLSTHSQGGVTDADLELAEEIERLA